ncbi:hypothetical protein LJC10_05855 [Selenomonadales bacterium OttesenSCG-928-I06]|nr:hypothetical protein [Selenomonadales bacterium OttesenSCG-928-I06]
MDYCCCFKTSTKILKSVALREQPIMAGYSVIFDENVIETCTKNIISHIPGTSEFIINKCGFYEVIYKFNYTTNNLGIITFMLDNIPGSRIVVQATTTPQTGYIAMTDVFMLPAGSVIDLHFVSHFGTSDSLLISDAEITIKKL